MFIRVYFSYTTTGYMAVGIKQWLLLELKWELNSWIICRSIYTYINFCIFVECSFGKWSEVRHIVIWGVIANGKYEQYLNSLWRSRRVAWSWPRGVLPSVLTRPAYTVLLLAASETSVPQTEDRCSLSVNTRVLLQKAKISEYQSLSNHLWF